jgi:indolepyruvate ferredoxin oxidoreductase alpha subunit
LGNEAIARGLVENGCAVATSYPGTPASEILAAVAFFQKENQIAMHTQWAVNEKVAFEIAYAGCQSGMRTAVAMKQVGLNVASDPLMSAAYMGVKGGFIVVSADDPGPISSQTEQDSRLMAMMARIPVLDPNTPRQAKRMVAQAYDISEMFNTVVMLRPTTRVCHSRQDVTLEDIVRLKREVKFEKDPSRWAATPRFRYHLHTEVEKKLADIARHDATRPRRLNPEAAGSRVILSSGVAAAHTAEILKEMGLWGRMPFYQVLQPFPLHTEFITHWIETYDEILVIEEPMAVIEDQLADRHRVKGKLSNTVSSVGELYPEHIEEILGKFVGTKTRTLPIPFAGARRPTLCAGCPHRASFFAIKKAARGGIFTSDIGCYTLGLNLGAVDTVLCMGAAISQASGFYHAYKNEEMRPDIVATIGDSTFFHAGVPALIDAVVQNVKFVLVILDNRTTAMTGSQPTATSGVGACGEALEVVDIEALVRGCGVKFCREGNPYSVEEFSDLMKEAVTYSREIGPAVVISRYPCVIDLARKGEAAKSIPIDITEDCDGCAYCIKHFECPALIYHDENEDEKYTTVDPILCIGCGVCLNVCPRGAIVEKGVE